MSAISKYLEYKQINMNFNDNYTVDNIPNTILVCLFDKIDDRIQLIRGDNDFIIIHRVSGNKIFKSMITKDNND